MNPLLFGPIDTVLMPYISLIVFVLILLNMVTRYMAHRNHLRGFSERGEDGITRHTVHVASTIVLVLACFYYATVSLTFGITLSVFALALLLTDFFEFESRLVEARTERPIEQPKAAVALSILMFVYAIYPVVVLLVGPFWQGII